MSLPCAASSGARLSLSPAELRRLSDTNVSCPDLDAAIARRSSGGSIPNRAIEILNRSPRLSSEESEEMSPLLHRRRRAHGRESMPALPRFNITREDAGDAGGSLVVLAHGAKSLSAAPRLSVDVGGNYLI
jgi:hypothetical protein